MQSVNNCGFKTGGGGGSPAATTPRCFNQLKHPGIIFIACSGASTLSTALNLAGAHHTSVGRRGRVHFTGAVPSGRGLLQFEPIYLSSGLTGPRLWLSHWLAGWSPTSIFLHVHRPADGAGRTTKPLHRHRTGNGMWEGVPPLTPHVCPTLWC